MASVFGSVNRRYKAGSTHKVIIHCVPHLVRALHVAVVVTGVAGHALVHQHAVQLVHDSLPLHTTLALEHNTKYKQTQQNTTKNGDIVHN